MVAGASTESEGRIQMAQMPPCSEGQMAMPFYVMVHTQTYRDRDREKERKRKTERDRERQTEREKPASVPLCPLSLCREQGHSFIYAGLENEVVG